MMYFKLKTHRSSILSGKAAIKSSLAHLLGLSADSVNVKAKTGEKVGHIGRGEAVGCHAVVLIEKD